MSFYFWNKIKVCTPGCPGVIYLPWCWQNMWSRWLTDWYDSLAICICPLFVFVLKFVLVFVGGKTREQMGSSCHSTAPRLIKLSANAPTPPPTNALLSPQSFSLRSCQCTFSSERTLRSRMAYHDQLCFFFCYISNEPVRFWKLRFDWILIKSILKYCFENKALQL